jgi:HD superfamily phosphodiesterase
MLTTQKYGIDESHGLAHSMDVLHYANQIFELEKIRDFRLEKQEKIIYVSAIIHDMCDKKYMNENDGLKNIEEFLQEKITKDEIQIVKHIVSTMSYSKVKKNGFPKLNGYQSAYHIVREADLLSAYDFDRAMIFSMSVHRTDVENAFLDTEKLFHSRMLRHIDDKLFITTTGRNIAYKLELDALSRMNSWKEILNKHHL